jgi:2-dehydro-3-deoxyphosphooctonate aldolase (KDO 8-P synthase)
MGRKREEQPIVTREVNIGGLRVGGKRSLFLIAGPCVIESAKHAMESAKRLLEISEEAGVPMIFKSSYDKANRTSIQSFRGPGMDAGLQVLGEIKSKLGVRVLSDVHSAEEAEAAGKVLDVLQIPAFLCRQTDLLLAAGNTRKTVNVKKGQFVAPWNMDQVIDKLRSTGNENILLTERGSMFGYNNLVADLRSLPIMRRFGFPVVFDATHSVQLPGGAGHASSGQSEFVPALARAAVAAGCDGVFMEVHPDPENAPSDGPNMITPAQLKTLLGQITRIRRALEGDA